MRRLLPLLVATMLTAAACATGGTSTTTAPSTSGPTTTEAPATTSPPSEEWTVQPVFEGGDAEWETTFVDPGAVVQDTDGRLHMFYNGGPDWPAPARVGHAVSEDGLSWSVEDPDGLFDGLTLEWRGISIFAGDAIQLPDGTWALYFHTLERVQSTDGARIGMATAQDPGGPWSVLPDPILEPSGEGSWDGAAVLNPSVVELPNGWLRMYYDGHDDLTGGDANRTIGTALSVDGYVWDREATVLQPSLDGWDATGVYDPNVAWTGDHWVMAYWSSRPDPDDGPSDEILALAFSEDGLWWAREPAPVLTSTSYGIADVLLSSALLTDDGFFVYFDALMPAWSSSVWVAQLPGRPEPSV